MKHHAVAPIRAAVQPFSILERIDVGETKISGDSRPMPLTTFSILERIDVGETNAQEFCERLIAHLSVSSNGSTWVKL